MSNRAWVTLATNDSYGLGALVLAHSLRRAGSAFPAVVLITPSVTEAMRDRLSAVFTEVVVVDVLDSGDAAHLALLQRPELGITFTKLHCWNLTQYDKCVFLDADTLIVQNCDELFDREELSAAPDVGWPDCFNSGVFVFKPSAETFSNLIKFAQERGSFDGGDQGLLNLYFSDWAHGDINKHLPFLYNVTSAAFYSYMPALKQYGQNLKIIHFIGATKPWLQHYNWRTSSVDAPEHLRDFLQLWWSLFVAEVHSKLDTSMVEVEEPSPEIPQQEPEYIEERQVLNTGHYEATLNPHSEFPWHHPDNQIKDPAEDEPTIDMTEFHDPWDIYRGHIPPVTNDSNQDDQPKEDYHEVRKYAWEYMPPVYEEHQKDYNPSQIESPFTEQPSQDTLYYHHEDYTRPQTETYHNTDYRQENPQIDQSSHHFYDQSHTEYDNHSHHYEPPKSFDNFNYGHHHHYTEPQNQHTQNQNPPRHNIQYDEWQSNNNFIAPSENTYHSNNVNFNEEPRHVIYNRPQEPIPIQNSTPYVYSVHLDYNIRKENGDPIVNGYGSDDECDIYEEIRPRHPYDGFYLRHRNTINSRGKKICSHEIPYLPYSPTVTPPGSPEVYEDAIEFPEETNEINGEDHTGVAGHLARIGEDLQSGAIDELVRRQGWEAGNIDYMGADSFDNIWAKISHTLSQAPSSPPKQQSPPAVTPPAQSPIEGKDSSPLKVPLLIPVEATATDLPQEEALPEPVETNTEELALKEPLPVSNEPDAKKVDAAEPQLAPVETVTKELVQEEPLPVPAEADTKNLSPDKPLPGSLETGTKQVPPEEAVPESVASDLKELPLEEPIPKPLEKLSAGDAPKPIETDTKELSSVAPPVPIKADDKALPSEVLPSPVKPDAKVQPLVPSPQTPNVKKTPEKPAPEPIKPDASPSEDKTEIVSDVPVSALGALKLDEKTPGPSDSPPLATTPSKGDAAVVPAAKSEERRKPAGKLQLHPPAAADPLPTPDSELEDAATLAQSIIASELRTPTVTSPSPSTEPPPNLARTQPSNLGVQEPEVPTPPVGAVSLTQIGIKPKSKPTIAAQIESSVSAKIESTPQTPTGSTPTTPSETEAPKKKLVKKVTKKEKEGVSSGEAPVPPPRKKEKKPKDK